MGETWGAPPLTSLRLRTRLRAPRCSSSARTWRRPAGRGRPGQPVSSAFRRNGSNVTAPGTTTAPAGVAAGSRRVTRSSARSSATRSGSSVSSRTLSTRKCAQAAQASARPGGRMPRMPL